MDGAGSRCSGAVLAGGLGSRLGGAKAKVMLGGRALISYPVAAIEAAGLEAVVVAKSGTELPALGVVRLDEPDQPRHPLCGIVAALAHAERQGKTAVVVIACDMPLVTPELVGGLARAEEPLVVPLAGGHPQPLAARYGTTLLPVLRKALRDGPGPLTGIVNSLNPRLLQPDELARFGDAERMFLNINTAAELKSAERLLARDARA